MLSFKGSITSLMRCATSVGGERFVDKCHPFERCLGHHQVQGKRAAYQRRHPPRMVGVDDPRSLHAPLLQNLEGGEMVLDPLFIFVWDTPLP